MGKDCILESGFSLEILWIRHLCRKRNLVSHSLCWYSFSAFPCTKGKAVPVLLPAPALQSSLPVSKEKAWEGQHFSFTHSFLKKFSFFSSYFMSVYEISAWALLFGDSFLCPQRCLLLPKLFWWYLFLLPLALKNFFLQDLLVCCLVLFCASALRGKIPV